MNTKEQDAKTVRLVSYPSVLGRRRWSFYRVMDGKGEANGFASEDEARDWATNHGYTVQP